MQNKPHPHKDLIIAWANGAEIEMMDVDDDHWYHIVNPKWFPDTEYRVKPVELPKAEWIYCNGKRPEGIPDGLYVQWFSQEMACICGPALINELQFHPRYDGSKVQFIKIVEDKDAE